MKPADWSVRRIIDAVRQGDCSARDVVDACLRRVEAVDSSLHAFLHVDRAGAMAAAERIDADRRAGRSLGPLAGLPVAVKDALCTADQPTTCGSRFLEGYVPPYDAEAVRRLRDAGAVIIGKTSLDEFAMGGSNENCAYGPVRNPWDPSRAPGGSSGGSAACVAAGMAPAAIGSDTGGSIRQPAGLCGITGLKPTYGRVSRRGLVAFASSLDQIGPMARSADDCSLLLETLAGHDAGDSTCLDEPVPAYGSLLDGSLEGIRIGRVPAHFQEGLDPQVRKAVEEAFAVYRAAGATIVDVDLPHASYGVATYYLIAPCEASSNLARYDGMHFGRRFPAAVDPQRPAGRGDHGSPLVDLYCASRAAGFGPEVKRRIMLGTYALSAGYYDAYYAKALRVRRLIRQDYLEAFAKVDLIGGPVSATAAFHLGEKTSDPLAMYLVDLYTVGTNLAGLAAISFPCGFTREGLPVGFHLQGPALSEPLLLRTADRFQRLTDWHARRPPEPSTLREGSRPHQGSTRSRRPEQSAPAYTTIIGLEVHVQLLTRSKLFCGCSTAFGASANTQVCPTCLGLPGSLPVMNRRAFDLAVRAALALNCRIAEFTKWDRKNYYYPDLPKGYQISQFDLPFSSDGWLEVVDPKGSFSRRVGIIRVHLEEDAGKSMHDETAGTADSRIDLNRAGTPLCEIVTQPDLRSPQEARAWLNELKLLLVYLGVSDCNMQEGSLRVDANVNLHIPLTDGGNEKARVAKTPIVEIKNMNSFRSVERALAYEAERQWAEWQATGAELGSAPKQTRGWDDPAGVTRAQRHKEESSDYRYFPEPDLVPVTVTAEQLSAMRADMGESPAALRQSLERKWAISAYDSDVLVNQGRELVGYFEDLAERVGEGKVASNWMQQDVLRTLNERGGAIGDFPIRPDALSDLIERVQRGDFDTSRGREIFAEMLASGRSVAEVVASMGIAVVGDDDLAALCRELLASNPKIVADVKGGKEQAAAGLIGQAKKKNPNVNPGKVRAMCLDLIREMG